MCRGSLVTAFAISAMLASGSAAAAFSDWDANNDGQLSKDEYYSGVNDAGIYADIDTDNDGFVDKGEVDAAGIDGDWDAWDADNDGYVDSDEFYEGVWTSYDVNEKGHWDGGEWDDAGDEGWFDV